MILFILLLIMALGGFLFFAIKFIGEEDKKQKKVKQKHTDQINNLEVQLKKTQEEFAKEKSEHQIKEGLMEKIKDELDNSKNVIGQLEQKAKDLDQVRETLFKKDEEIKKEAVDKEKFKSELDLAKKEAEQAKKDKENLQKELDSAKKEAEQTKKDKENLLKELEAAKKVTALPSQDMGPLKEENEELKNKLKLLEEVHEGLKGQYDELSKEMESINQQRLSEAAGQAPKPDVQKPAGAEVSEDKTKQDKKDEPQSGSPQENPGA